MLCLLLTLVICGSNCHARILFQVVGKAVNRLCVRDLLLCVIGSGSDAIPCEFLVLNGEEVWAERPWKCLHMHGLTACQKGHMILHGEVELFTAALNSVPVARNAGAESQSAQLSPRSRRGAAGARLFPHVLSGREESFPRAAFLLTLS